MVLPGTEKFGDYVLCAGLLEAQHVLTIHGVLKPKTLKCLQKVSETAPLIKAMRDDMKKMPEMKSEEEFLPLALLWKRREAKAVQSATQRPAKKPTLKKT